MVSHFRHCPSFALGIGFGRSASAVVSHFRPCPSFALGIGYDCPLPRWFRIFPVLRLRWVSGLTVPLSRWFRIFYPVLRLRWVSGLTVPLSRWFRALPFWCFAVVWSFIWAKG